MTYSTSLSFSHFSKDVVGFFSDAPGFRKKFYDSLELGNRVDEATFKDTVESIQSVLDSHQRLRSLIYSDVVDPTTSKTNLVLLALNSLTLMVQDDVATAGAQFLESFQYCYNTNVHYLIESVSSQLTYCSQELAKMQLISDLYPAIDEARYYYLATAVEKMAFLQYILDVSETKLKESANMYKCPANCFEKSCSSELLSFNEQVIDFYNIGDIVSKALTILNNSLKATGAPFRPPAQDSPTTPSYFPSSRVSQAVSFAAAPSPPTSSPAFNRSSPPKPSPTPAPRDAPSTWAVEEMPPSMATVQSSSPQTNSFYNDIANNDLAKSFREVVVQLNGAQNSMNQLSKCVTRYADFLKDFQTFLSTLDLNIASVDIMSASSALNTLSQDTHIVEDLLRGYCNNSLTKRLLSTKFLEEVSSLVTFHADSAVSNLDTYVISEITGIIGTTEKKVISAYSQLISFLSQLKSFLPSGLTAADDFARKLRLWKRPVPMLQDKEVRPSDRRCVTHTNESGYHLLRAAQISLLPIMAMPLIADY